MQLLFGVAFAVVASVCIKLATGYLPVEGQQGYDNGHVGKKGTSARYADHERNGDPSPSCTMEADYEISQNYIIRTKDSKANGANFIAALNVRTFDVCLEQCCLKENCDTTIFVGEAYRSEETNCFLFMCRPEGRGGENRCLFTYHLGYISSMKKAVGGFQGYEPDPVVPVAVTTAIPVQQIATTAKPTLPPVVEPEPISNCPEGYFECDSGQCINELYICNTVVDCDDGSDEYRCSPQEPPPAENTNSDDASATDDQKLPPSLLMPPTNPPNMPNNYPDDSTLGHGERESLKGEPDQTLADQLNDQSPLGNDDRSQSAVQDAKQEDRERELSDMKTRLQDENRGSLPQVLNNPKPDKNNDRDQFPELECHGASCYEVQPDGGKTRFGDIQVEEDDQEEVEREREEDEEALKLKQQNRQKNPVDTPPRNLEREEYQTGDLRDDDYQPQGKAQLPDYREDSRKFVYNKNTDEYREDKGEDDNRYDITGGVDEEDEQKGGRGGEDRYEVNEHLSDVEDRDASRQRDYDPIDRKMVSDHDMGMKHPADVGSTRNDHYRDQGQDRQDSPPLRDGTKNWGFPDKPPQSRPPTQPPVRQGVSQSEARLGAGYGYNSDYYSYYYPPYGQTQGQGRYRSQQTKNNNWPSDRSRQDSYSGRTSQGGSYYQSKNSPYRPHGTQGDNTNRYGTNSDVYGNSRRYHKVSDIPADRVEEKYPSNDAKIQQGYNSLWNTWPYDYSSSVDDKVVIDNDRSFQNANRNRPSYTASSKSRPHPKGHKLNGIANNAPAPPNSLPTSTTTLSSIHRAVVTQAPVPMDKDAIVAVQPDEAVTVMAPINEAVSDGKVEGAGKTEDAGKVNDTNILKEEGDEITDEMMYESRGGSGMPPASSAILPLVIGLIITVCLLLMVGCRLRFMNQRLRYGRLKTSAHDADYLINGMYL